MTHRKSFTIIGICMIAILLVSAIWIGSAFGGKQLSPESGSSPESTAYDAKSYGQDGTVTSSDGSGHRTLDEIKAQHGASLQYQAISDANALLAAIGEDINSTPVNPGKVLYLTQDITLPQVTLRKTHLQPGVIFDGNGYTVRLSSGYGNFDGPEPARNNYFTADGEVLRPMYGGVFVGMNEGKICNTRFVYTSNHSYNGSIWSETGNAYKSVGVYASHGAYSVPAYGIVTGINAGTIDNCYLDMQDAFTAIKEGCSTLGNHARLDYNSIFVGGIAAAMYPDSTISNSTFYMENGTTLAGISQGNRRSATANQAGMAIVGGIVGNVTASGDRGVKLYNVTSLSGGDNCHIYAETGYADDWNYYASAGSVIGGAVAVRNLVEGVIVNLKADTIVGMIDGWRGMVHYNWRALVGGRSNVKDLPIGMAGSADGSIPASEQIKNFVFLFSYEGNALNASGTLTSTQSAKLWSTVQQGDANGTLGVKFESQSRGSELRFYAAAKESGAENKPFATSAKLSGTMGYIFWGISSDTEAEQLMVTDGYIQYTGTLNLSVPKSMQFNFGYLATYSLEAQGATNKQYDGQPLENARMRLIGHTPDLTTSLNKAENFNEEAFDGYWFREVDGALQQVGTKGDRSQTVLPGSYTYKVEKSVKVGAGQEKFGYFDTTRRIAAKYVEDPILYYVSSCALQVDYNKGSDVTNGFVKDLEFQVSIQVEGESRSTDLFDYFTYLYNGIESDPIEKPAGAAYATYRHDKGSTGVMGANYIFIAYKYVDGRPVQIATSDVCKVYVDQDAPEIQAQFYYSDNGELKPIEESEVSKYWWNKPIHAEFTVTETSGVQTYESSDRTPIQKDGDKYTINFGQSKGQRVITFVDKVGNTATREYMVNIDTTNPVFSFSKSNYAEQAMYNGGEFASDTVTVEYGLAIGGSGWELQFATSEGDTPVSLENMGSLEWTTARTFDTDMATKQNALIDWNFQGFLYMRLHNTAIGFGGNALFDDVYISKSGQTVGKVDGDTTKPNAPWDMRLRLATIYMSANNLKIGDTALKDSTDDQIRDLVSKVYDATNEYKGDAFSLLVGEVVGGLVGNVQNYSSGMRVEYSQSAMNKGITSIDWNAIEILTAYSDVNANDNGAWLGSELYLDVTVKGKDAYSDGKNYDERYRVVFEGKWAQGENNVLRIPAMIRQYQRTENLAQLLETLGVAGYTRTDLLSGKLVYGNKLPDTLLLESQGFSITFTLFGEPVTGLAGVNEVGYLVEAVASQDRNVLFVVEDATIFVTPLPVPPQVYTDDEIDGDFSFQFDGKEHGMSATYEDVFGATKDMVVTYYSSYTSPEVNTPMDGKPVQPGIYYAILSTGDANYSVFSFTEVWELEIYRGFLNIESKTQVKAYNEGKKVEYKVELSKEEQAFVKDGEMTIQYFRYHDNAKYDPSTQTITGTYDPAPIDPINVGYYKVVILFVPTEDSETYYPEKYDSLLVIEKAKVSLTAEDISFEYDATKKFTYDTAVGKATFHNVTNDTIIATDDPDLLKEKQYPSLKDKQVKLQYQDENGDWQNVEGENGYFTNVKYSQLKVVMPYRYRLFYEGDENYETAELPISMTIQPAEIKGVTFDSLKVPFDGKEHGLTLDLGGYAELEGLTVRYGYGTQWQDTPYLFTEAKKYALSVEIKIPNYKTLTLSADLEIETLKFDGVTLIGSQVTYDGQEHGVTLDGLDYNAETGAWSYNGVPVKVSGQMGGYTDAGKYEIAVSLSAENYEFLTLKAMLEIKPLEVTEFGGLMSDKVDLNAPITTETDLSSLYSTIVGLNGETIQCTLQYIDSKGNVVKLEDGKLPAGTYTVRVVPKSGNYKLADSVNIQLTVELGQGQKMTLIIVGAVVGVVLIAAIVVIAIVVSRKKKAPKTPDDTSEAVEPQPQVEEQSQSDQPQESADVPKAEEATQEPAPKRARKPRRKSPDDPDLDKM